MPPRSKPGKSPPRRMMCRHPVPIRRASGGAPRKARNGQKEPTRLERQMSQSVEEMLAELPTDCDVGTKKNSKGYKESWAGYKLHIDVVDGQIPVCCLLTSASVHDSQVAIPLMSITGHRGRLSVYDIIDSAYDAAKIIEHSRSLGHVPRGRHQLPHQRRLESRAPSRGQAAGAADPAARPRRGHLQFPDDGRAGQCSLERRIRRTVRPRREGR